MVRRGGGSAQLRGSFLGEMEKTTSFSGVPVMSGMAFF